jgi:hypothetical protein
VPVNSVQLVSTTSVVMRAPRSRLVWFRAPSAAAGGRSR